MDLNLKNRHGDSNADSANDVAKQQAADHARTESSPITQRAGLVNNPPPVVDGVSQSLVESPEIEHDSDDSDSAQLAAGVAAETAANRGLVPDAGGKIFSSHPVANFRLGRFHFDKGMLRLDDKDADEFSKLLETLPVTERMRIRELDVSAAESIVRERLSRPGATQQFDSTVGERASDVKGPRSGTVPLGHASLSQRDMNQPVVDPTGEGGAGEDVVKTQGQSDNG